MSSNIFRLHSGVCDRPKPLDSRGVLLEQLEYGGVKLEDPYMPPKKDRSSGPCGVPGCLEHK